MGAKLAVTLRRGQKLMMIENWMMMKISGAKSDEISRRLRSFSR
jgi:hypothetical protein